MAISFINHPQKLVGGQFSVFFRFFVANIFWIRLTGEGTSEVTSGTSGNHLMVTSATKKKSGLLDWVAPGTLEKTSSRLW